MQSRIGGGSSQLPGIAFASGIFKLDAPPGR